MRRASIGLGILSSAILMAQTSGAPEPVSAPRPMLDEAVRLQHLFGKMVTNEDPVWRWTGDSEPIGRRPRPNEVFQLKFLSYVRPADSGNDVGLILARTLDAYHQQTDGPRFVVVPSRWGLHIVPDQVRDEPGRWVQPMNPLDAKITVPAEERTAEEHFIAILNQVSLATAIRVQFVPAMATRIPDFDPFEWNFAAIPSRFRWGTSGSAARDALLDLLEHSATTFSWHLNCVPLEAQCYFNIGWIMTSVNGGSTDTGLAFDRCGACIEVKNRPAPVNPNGNTR